MNPSFLVPWLILSAGQGADVASSRHAFAQGCQEGNRLIFGAHPTTARLVTSKAVLGGGVVLGALALRKLGHPTAAKRITYSLGLAGGAASVWNLAVCR